MPGQKTAMAEAAREYLQRGWSVIPLRPHDKRPLIAWHEFQTRRAHTGAVDSWWGPGTNANLGVVTGQISGLVVLDLDGEQGRTSVRDRQLPITPIAQTGHGWHYYFAHPGTQVDNAVGILPGVDLRGDGGYVVAPPSIHQSGARYHWLVPPFSTPLAPLPAWLRSSRQRVQRPTARPERTGWRHMLQTQVPEGRRNQTLTRIAGYLLRIPGVDPFASFELVFAWNQVYCQPPLGRDEVIAIFNSIATREATRRLRRETDV